MLLFILHNYRIVASLGLDKLSLLAFGFVVDTGAGPNFARRNDLAPDWLRQVVTSQEEEKGRLRDANNARFRTSGTVTLWLQTGARIVPVPFLVVEDLSVWSSWRARSSTTTPTPSCLRIGPSVGRTGPSRRSYGGRWTMVTAQWAFSEIGRASCRERV